MQLTWLSFDISLTTTQGPKKQSVSVTYDSVWDAAGAQETATFPRRHVQEAGGRRQTAHGQISSLLPLPPSLPELPVHVWRRDASEQ